MIAVGASDMWGSRRITDDRVAPFSARAGGRVAPGRGPDVVAPGIGIVSLRAPFSAVAVANPKARVGAGGLRGSGTSQATAVVSGAVALLLQQRPELTPSQVKDLLRGSAHRLAGFGSAAQGAGELDVAAAPGLPAAAGPIPAGPGPGSRRPGPRCRHGLARAGAGRAGAPGSPARRPPRAGRRERDAPVVDASAVDRPDLDRQRLERAAWTTDLWEGRTWTSDLWSSEFSASQTQASTSSPTFWQ